MMQLFDAPDSIQGVGKREESTVATQALAMLNSPIIRGFASKLAERIKPSGETGIGGTIAAAYRIVFSRLPTESELAAMKGFVQTQTESRGANGNAEAIAIEDFCHLLLCMNEFVYID